MNNVQGHIIAQVKVDLDFEDALSAEEISAAVQAELSTRLGAILQRHCDALAGPGDYVRLERLGLDLGPLAVESPKDSFVEKLDEALAAALAGVATDKDLEQGGPLGRALGVLENYAATGQYPWWAGQPDARMLLEAMDMVLANWRTASRAAVAVLSSSQGLRRLVLALKPAQLQALWSRLREGSGAYLGKGMMEPLMAALLAKAEGHERPGWRAMAYRAIKVMLGPPQEGADVDEFAEWMLTEAGYQLPASSRQLLGQSVALRRMVSWLRDGAGLSAGAIHEGFSQLARGETPDRMAMVLQRQWQVSPSVAERLAKGMLRAWEQSREAAVAPARAEAYSEEEAILALVRAYEEVGEVLGMPWAGLGSYHKALWLRYRIEEKTGGLAVAQWLRKKFRWSTPLAELMAAEVSKHGIDQDGAASAAQLGPVSPALQAALPLLWRSLDLKGASWEKILDQLCIAAVAAGLRADIQVEALSAWLRDKVGLAGIAVGEVAGWLGPAWARLHGLDGLKGQAGGPAPRAKGKGKLGKGKKLAEGAGTSLVEGSEGALGDDWLKQHGNSLKAMASGLVGRALEGTELPEWCEELGEGPNVGSALREWILGQGARRRLGRRRADGKEMGLDEVGLGEVGLEEGLEAMGLSEPSEYQEATGPEFVAWVAWVAEKRALGLLDLRQLLSDMVLGMAMGMDMAGWLRALKERFAGMGWNQSWPEAFGVWSAATGKLLQWALRAVEQSFQQQLAEIEAATLDSGPVGGLGFGFGVGLGGEVGAGLLDAGALGAGLPGAEVLGDDVLDAGAFGAGVVDAGAFGAGVVDAGALGAGLHDAGAVDARDTLDSSGTLDAGELQNGNALFSSNETGHLETQGHDGVLHGEEGGLLEASVRRFVEEGLRNAPLDKKGLQEGGAELSGEVGTVREANQLGEGKEQVHVRPRIPRELVGRLMAEEGKGEVAARKRLEAHGRKKSVAAMGGEGEGNPWRMDPHAKEDSAMREGSVEDGAERMEMSLQRVAMVAAQRLGQRANGMEQAMAMVLEAYHRQASGEPLRQGTLLRWLLRVLQLRRVDARRLAAALLRMAEVHGLKGDKVDGGVAVEVSQMAEAYPQVRQHIAGRPSDDALPFYVENAGLVVFWPYLQRYFQYQGLLEEKSWVSPVAQEQGVRLLQGMATPGTSWDESVLALPKLLCGLAPDAVVDPWVELPEGAEGGEDTLIEVVLGHWSGAGKLVPDAFRAAWLLRSGTLRLQGDHWLLRVEKQAHDMLLDSLPWEIGFVTLPWMGEVLYVDWADKAEFL